MKLEYVVISPTTSLLNIIFKTFFRCVMHFLRDGSYGNISPSPREDLAPGWSFGLCGCITCSSEAGHS